MFRRLSQSCESLNGLEDYTILLKVKQLDLKLMELKLMEIVHTKDFWEGKKNHSVKYGIELKPLCIHSVCLSLHDQINGNGVLI